MPNKLNQIAMVSHTIILTHGINPTKTRIIPQHGETHSRHQPRNGVRQKILQKKKFMTENEPTQTTKTSTTP